MLLGTANGAGAQTNTNLALDRALLRPGAGVTFAADGGETLPRGAVFFTARCGALGRPWVLRNGLTGETVAVPVARAFTAEVAAAIGVTGRLQVGLAQPVTLYQSGDRLRGVADDRPLSTTVGGDARLHLKASMVDAAAGGGRLTLAFAPFIAAPTGDAAQFAGVGSVWGELRLAGGWRRGGLLAVADLGLRLRSPTVFYGVRHDTAALTFALGAAWTLPARALRRRLTLILDVDGDAQGPGRPVPVEARGGMSVRAWRGLHVAAAGGVSVSREPGAPPWRALVEVRLAAAR
ncbi:MAG: hypothetical protein HY906_05565 [Deltaproteobacteria bacterium]|nr:hypothetical protein [Deltaproteobacteria bacterium]